MKKQISSYVGSAGHLYKLVTGNLHPKLRRSITLEQIPGYFNFFPDLEKEFIPGEPDIDGMEQDAEEAQRDEKNVKESEEITKD